MSELRVTMVQFAIAWCNKEENFNYLEKKLQNISTDLVVLPEMFQTGFSCQDKLQAENMTGETMNWLMEMSLKINASICGSFLCSDEGHFVNRFVIVQGGEMVGYYDKVHLFGMGGEDAFLSAGSTKVDVVLNGFKLRPIICYDLRFPYLSYNDSDYDALLCVANWPSQRIAHWDTLLQARAIENQAYVLGCNRVGEQDGLFYPGHSSIYLPNGTCAAHSHKEEVLHVTLTKDVIQETREQFPFLQDRKM